MAACKSSSLVWAAVALTRGAPPSYAVPPQVRTRSDRTSRQGRLQFGTDASLVDARHGAVSSAILVPAAIATSAVATPGALVRGRLAAAMGKEIGTVARGIGFLAGGEHA